MLQCRNPINIVVSFCTWFDAIGVKRDTRAVSSHLEFSERDCESIGACIVVVVVSKLRRSLHDTHVVVL